MTENEKAGAGPRGHRDFYLVFVTQTLSLFASSIAAYSLRVFLFQATQSVTAFTRLTLVCMLPDLVLWSVAGSLADRYRRQRIMVVCDLVAALASCWLYYDAVLTDSTGATIAPWSLYVVAAVIAVANALQSPCFEACVITLVDPDFLPRAQGLQQCAFGVAALLAPLLSGVLVDVIGLAQVLLLDIVMAFVAVGCLLAVDIPDPEVTATGVAANQGSWLDDAQFGYRFLRGQPVLAELLVMFAVSNFCTTHIFELLPPLVLSVADPAALGFISTVAGGGMLLSSVLMATWGLPRHWDLVALTYALLLLQGVTMLFALREYDHWLIALLGFVYSFCDPLIQTAAATLWSERVPPDVQGRVFAFRDFIATAAAPLAVLNAGPLADWFEDSMATVAAPTPRALVRVCQALGIRVGHGRGICLLFVIFGGVLVIASLPSCWRHRRRWWSASTDDPSHPKLD